MYIQEKLLFCNMIKMKLTWIDCFFRVCWLMQNDEDIACSKMGNDSYFTAC